MLGQFATIFHLEIVFQKIWATMVTGPLEQHYMNSDMTMLQHIGGYKVGSQGAP